MNELHTITGKKHWGCRGCRTRCTVDYHRKALCSCTGHVMDVGPSALWIFIGKPFVLSPFPSLLFASQFLFFFLSLFLSLSLCL